LIVSNPPFLTAQSFRSKSSAKNRRGKGGAVDHPLHASDISAKPVRPAYPAG